MRRENLIKVSPKISAYLEGIELKGVVVDRVAEQREERVGGTGGETGGAGGRGGYMKKATRLIFHIWRDEWDLAKTHASDYYNYSPIVQQEYRKLLKEAE